MGKALAAAVGNNYDARSTTAGASRDAHAFAVPSVELPVPETYHAALGVDSRASCSKIIAPTLSARDASTAANKATLSLSGSA